MYLEFGYARWRSG